MIDPQEFLSAGFSESQAASLVRAFERADRASAQRFALLQDTLNDAVVRIEQRFERIEQRFADIDQRFERVEQQISRLAEVVAQSVAVTERVFAQIDERFVRIEE